MASFCWSLMHSTGVDSPTPRGSRPTTSKRLSTSTGRVSADCTAESVAEMPGPPGLTSSDPIRPVCPASTARTRKSCSVGPVGSAWSTGTVVVPQENARSRSAPGRPAMMVEIWASQSVQSISSATAVAGALDALGVGSASSPEDVQLTRASTVAGTSPAAASRRRVTVTITQGNGKRGAWTPAQPPRTSARS
jgi:hypothetical protein